jgi:hypothetical protein
MTLIVGLISPVQAILVSDRRYTLDRKLIDEEGNKATVFVCRDARMAVAFTGLAEMGSFKTSTSLVDTLQQASRPDQLLLPTVGRFALLMSGEIKKVGIAATQRHLTVVLVGYRYEGPSYRPVLCQVSNAFDNTGKLQESASDEFAVWWRTNPLGVFGFGKCAGVALADRTRLRELMAQGRPAAALVDKSVETIMNAADSPKSNGLVGKQCNSIVLPADLHKTAIVHYHSATVTNQMYFPSVVLSTPSASLSIEGASIQARTSAGAPSPLAVPKVGKNQRCPYGSGKKYKRCCRRVPTLPP